jgi:hypothetical protein
MLKIRVSGTEDKVQELDKSVKHNEKISQNMIRKYKATMTLVKDKIYGLWG